MKLVSLAMPALLSLWAILALWMDVRDPGLRLLFLGLYGLCIGVSVWFLRNPFWEAGALVAGFAVVLSWWLSLEPTNMADWKGDVARLGWAEVHGNQVTVHNIRDFLYTTEDVYTPRWNTRTYDLSRLQAVDLFVTHWGVPLVAHGMLSFDFGEDRHLAISIEVREKVGQDYSALRGFFRQYELSYIPAEERDIVRVRTTFRPHEEVYLYRTRLNSADARALFLQYVGWMDQALAVPQWYNALTRNCSTPITNYLAERHIGGISRWDWRTVLNGHGEAMLFDLGDLAGGGPFDRLRRQAWINPVARRVPPQGDFSGLIRRGRLGF